jgi:hypothetical protein
MIHTVRSANAQWYSKSFPALKNCQNEKHRIPDLQAPDRKFLLVVCLVGVQYKGYTVLNVVNVEKHSKTVIHNSIFCQHNIIYCKSRDNIKGNNLIWIICSLILIGSNWCDFYLKAVPNLPLQWSTRKARDSKARKLSSAVWPKD